MTPEWVSVLTTLVPLALIVALSPLTVIPAVLVLNTPRPRATGMAFAVGWLITLAGLSALFVELSGLLGGLHRTPPAWASWLRIALGSALIMFGIYRWLTRHRHTDMPGWMRSFTGMTPWRAGVTGVVLAVIRPEVSLMCAAAGLAIGSAGLEQTGVWTATGFFVGIASATVTIPILGFVAAGDRVDAALGRLRTWMEQQHAAMLAVALILIGAMVAYNGIHAL